MKGWIVALIAFGIYFVSIFGGFVQDDVKVIKNNSSWGDISSLGGVWMEPYYKNEPNAGAYRPVTSFSFAVNALVLGKEAWGYRLINVILYSYLCWLVYVFLKIVFGENKEEFMDSRLRGNDLPLASQNWQAGRIELFSFVTAIVFAVHPIHTEAVNNIVGRSEILALIFILWMIIWASKKRWEASVLMLFLAMLSKESAIVGVVILMFLVWREKVIITEKMGAVIYVVMTVIGYFGLRVAVLGNYLFSNNATVVENPLKFLPFGERLLGAMATLYLGIEKLIFPWNLSYDHSFSQIELPVSVFDFRVVVGFLLIIFSSVYLYRLSGLHQVRYETDCGTLSTEPIRSGMTKQLMVLMGMMLFWLPLLVTGNFIFATGTIFGERLWLMPSLGFLMVIFSGVRLPRFDFRQRRTRAMTIVVVIIVLFGIRTLVRNFDWLSERRLFLHDAKYVTKSVMAASNEAAMWLSERDFDKAKLALDRGEKIYPEYPMLMNNWGIYYWWKGEKTLAKEKFEKCLKVHPKDGLCLSNLELLK